MLGERTCLKAKNACYPIFLGKSMFIAIFIDISDIFRYFLSYGQYGVIMERKFRRNTCEQLMY